MKIKIYNDPHLNAKPYELYWKIIEEFPASVQGGALDFEYNDETRDFIIRFVDRWIPFPFEYMVMQFLSFIACLAALIAILKFFRHRLWIGSNF